MGLVCPDRRRPVALHPQHRWISPRPDPRVSCQPLVRRTGAGDGETFAKATAPPPLMGGWPREKIKIRIIIMNDPGGPNRSVRASGAAPPGPGGAPRIAGRSERRPLAGPRRRPSPRRYAPPRAPASGRCAARAVRAPAAPGRVPRWRAHDTGRPARARPAHPGEGRRGYPTLNRLLRAVDRSDSKCARRAGDRERHALPYRLS